MHIGTASCLRAEQGVQGLKEASSRGWNDVPHWGSQQIRAPPALGVCPGALEDQLRGWPLVITVHPPHLPE